MMEAFKGMKEISQIRGRGLMIGLQFDFAVAPLRKHLLYEEKVFTGSAGDPNTLRLLPPLILSRQEADQFVERFARALQHLSVST